MVRVRHRWSTSARASALVAAALAAAARPAGAAPPRWQRLPEPPAMPAPAATGDLPIDDFTLHYAVFGKGDPVILLHGGLGNGAHWANQIGALDGAHLVVVVDSRGQGRSTASKHGIGYHRMAEDVVALMDHLRLRRAAIVGWSDGAITGLDLAIHHPDRVARLFAFGANYDLTGMNPAGGRAATVTGYFARCKREYRRLSPAPKQLDRVLHDLRRMWTTEPSFTEAELRSIAAPTVIADGDHDEIIRRAHVEKLASLIPGAKLVIFRDASHFALWQDPDGFDRALADFLAPAAASPPTRAPPPAPYAR